MLVSKKKHKKPNDSVGTLSPQTSKRCGDVGVSTTCFSMLSALLLAGRRQSLTPNRGIVQNQMLFSIDKKNTLRDLSRGVLLNIDAAHFYCLNCSFIYLRRFQLQLLHNHHNHLRHNHPHRNQSHRFVTYTQSCQCQLLFRVVA